MQWLVAALFLALMLSTSVYLVMKRVGIEPDLTETIMLASAAILAGLGFVYALASETDQAAVATWQAHIKPVLVHSGDLTNDKTTLLLASPELIGWAHALPKKRPALQFEASMLDKTVSLDLNWHAGSGRLTIQPRPLPTCLIYPAER